MVRLSSKQQLRRKNLEDHEPGATRRQVHAALGKVAKPLMTNGRKKNDEGKAVKMAADYIVAQHLETFKELERH